MHLFLNASVSHPELQIIYRFYYDTAEYFLCMYPNLVNEVSEFVHALFEDKLPAALTFHNIDHTKQVVKAVKQIGFRNKLTGPELQLLEIAAWFHDTGYIHTYEGHEEESKKIAKTFFEDKDILSDEITLIMGCIEATKFPQNPLNHLERVMCDADLFHFSLPGYPALSSRLRTEWAVYLQTVYTDNEWNKANCKMLSKHRYHTDYGRRVLEPQKSINVINIQFHCL